MGNPGCSATNWRDSTLRYVTSGQLSPRLSWSAGTILKLDVWRQSGSENAHDELRGTTNFRRVEGCSLYALAQPTEDGIANVIKAVSADHPRQRPVWLNLREEPLIYLNGASFVQRELSVTLRNMKSYACVLLQLIYAFLHIWRSQRHLSRTARSY